jgi:beta-glucosidase
MNNRTYRYFNGIPLYGFGYGLSYSKFEYGNLMVPATISTSKKVIVSVTVTNKGKMDGEEVTELYLSHLGVKEKAPIKALKGFERTFIKAGQSKVIKFELNKEDLTLVDAEGNSKIVKGKLMISTGGSQPDAETRATKKTVSKTVLII